MLGIGGRSSAIQGLLRSLLVVFAPPCFDDCPGVQQVGEPVFVEALVAQTTVERFDVGVLVRLARFDQPQLYTSFVRPRHHRLAAELLAVIGADDLGQASTERQPIQHSSQPLA